MPELRGGPDDLAERTARAERYLDRYKRPDPGGGLLIMMPELHRRQGARSRQGKLTKLAPCLLGHRWQVYRRPKGETDASLLYLFCTRPGCARKRALGHLQARGEGM